MIESWSVPLLILVKATVLMGVVACADALIGKAHARLAAALWVTALCGLLLLPLADLAAPKLLNLGLLPADETPVEAFAPDTSARLSAHVPEQPAQPIAPATL